MIEKTLVDVLSEVEKLAKSKKNRETNRVFIKKPTPLAGLISIRLEKEEVNYDIKSLEDVTLAAIADYVLHLIDSEHKTTLLKNTNFKGTMLLDGITSYLPAYNLLRCIPIKEEEVIFYFKDPLDIEVIVDLVQSAVLPWKISLKELKTKRGSNITELYLANIRMLQIENYAISFPYRNLAENGRLEEGLLAATGLVTRIHQDTLFRKDIKKVYFAQYQPIFKLIFPELFEDRMTGFLKSIQELVRTKKLYENPDFKETRSSKSNTDDKRYVFDKNKLPEHLEYIVVCPDKQEVYIRFGSNFDYERIQKMLRPLNFSMSDSEEKLFTRTTLIKKGGGYRKKSRRINLKEREINDQYGSRLVTLESGNIIKLNLSQYDAAFEQAAMIFGEIYYGRLFYTGFIPTSEIGSDISKNERRLICSIDALAKLYTTFLQVTEEKQRLLLMGQGITPLGWIAERMSESPSKTFEGRILYVLNEIDRRVSPQDFYKYGREKETQQRIQTSYRALQELKIRFKSFCAQKS